MVSFRIKFRPSSVEDKEGIIYYQIFQSRVVRQLKTTYRIFPDEWDEKSGTIKMVAGKRSNYLQSVRERIIWDVKRLQSIINQCEYMRLKCTADSVVSAFQEHACEHSLFPFLHNRGLTRNTTSFYMRILRAVYNRAVEKRLTIDQKPFKHVYTGIDKTVKQALQLNIIKKMKNLNLSSHPSLAFARDMFLFSFYTRGMSFIDMAYLKKKDLSNGILSYRRRKAGQQLFIRWEKCMQEIVRNTLLIIPTRIYCQSSKPHTIETNIRICFIVLINH